MTGDENNNMFLIPIEDKFEPCKVCGEPSSGWHCGAVTCEACKKFFLRSINGEDTKYRCLRNQDCVIVRTTRTQCQYCRFKKCKEVGMTLNENTNNPKVADLFKGVPCRVCKASSSGVHFGAITCEGCKGFFRRSIKDREPGRYRCMENGNCEISVATRNMCKYCRYQRCLTAGMSENNSRIGRQSNLFKQQIIEWQNRGAMTNPELLVNQRKIKRIKSEATFNSNNNNDYYDYDVFMDMSHLQPSSSAQLPISNPNQQQLILNNYQNSNQYQTNQLNENNNNLNSLIDPSANGRSYSSAAINGNNNYNQQTNNYLWSNTNNNQLIDNSQTILKHQQTSMTSHQQQIASNGIEDTFEEPIKNIIKKVTSSYIQHLSSIADAAKENRDVFKFQNYQRFNQINSIYLEIIKHLNVYANYFENFTKEIPEIEILCKEDQEELVKCSIHSVIMLALQRKCNYYNYFNLDQTKSECLLEIFPKFSIASSFMRTIHDKFEKFKLDEKEYALYSALIVISTASRNLKDYDKIMEIREKIGTALRTYMFARRNDEIYCDEILIMLIHFRKLNMILQSDMVYFHHKSIETNIFSFKNYPFFFKVFMPNSSK